ncbi:hypothetical protein QBZ16_001040 [Prototheca wickerhamii]|uniref:Serine-threonine kinase receptor-associated protein n=1 Tax=Prototheca wickerhamii TaxID=3111 RepID=A0AAD9MGC2_PROWI|nr:hypothetical protein QBZ16_001040 [Prototheca wickerhamii]
MRPYILQGHSRPLNQVRYNREGDLLVTCGKDKVVNLWFTEDGQRAGTFNGHTDDSNRLLTGGADSFVFLWDVNTGEEQWRIDFRQPCRAVRFSVGEELAAVSIDPFMQDPSAVHILPIAADPSEQRKTPLREDGMVRRWDAETGKELLSAKVHDKAIQDLQMSADGTHFITASTDCSAKLIDTATLEVLKVYQSNVPVNSAGHLAAVRPRQEASQVTTTSARSGRFESRFFHKMYQEEFGNVRGHFGPINAVAFSPDGTGFVSGGEEGYVRLHKFDADYFTTKFF